MKSIRIITVSLILIFAFYGNVAAQQQNKTPWTADRIVKVIDDEVKLTAEQKSVLQKRSSTIIEKRKGQTKLSKDSTSNTIPAVLDSLLTSEQKEVMKINRKKRCEDAVKKYKEKNNSKK